MISDTVVQGEHKRTTLTCDNAECGHGFIFSTSTEADVPHTEEIVRQAAAKNAGWGQTQRHLDLCDTCLPEWTPVAEGDVIKPVRETPKKIHYGNGVWGWSHRVVGPTKTVQEGQPIPDQDV